MADTRENQRTAGLQLRCLSRRRRFDAHVSQKRTTRSARWHELSRSRSAGFSNHDSAITDENTRTRPRGRNRHWTEANQIAQSVRISKLRHPGATDRRGRSGVIVTVEQSKNVLWKRAKLFGAKRRRRCWRPQVCLWISRGSRRPTPTAFASSTRYSGDTDVYFVANRFSQPEDAVCEFRVAGKRPELWHADTGLIERPAVYDDVGGTVRMPLRLIRSARFLSFSAKENEPKTTE